jgi:hypothetical protein
MKACVAAVGEIDATAKARLDRAMATRAQRQPVASLAELTETRDQLLALV